MVLNTFKRRRKRLIAQSQPYQGMFHNTAKGGGGENAYNLHYCTSVNSKSHARCDVQGSASHHHSSQ